MENRKPDYKSAVNKAARVLDVHAYSDAPVFVDQIIESEGIRLKGVEFSAERQDIAGYIDFDKNTIYVNVDDAPVRQRFTMAHELGHYFLHKDYITNNPSSYQVLLRRPIGAALDAMEIEANTFAGHLLVPDKHLKHYMATASVPSLARIFAVSEEVIRNRLRWVERGWQ